MSGFQPDDSTIARFISATGCDPVQARFFLEATHGNFELAAQMLHDNMAFAPQTPATVGGPQPSPPLPLPPRPRAPAAPVGRNMRIGGLLGAALALPFALLRTGIGYATAVLNFSLNVAGFFGDRFLPGVVMRTVRAATNSLVRPREELDPATQAQMFIQRFKAQYGDRHPRFLDVSWRQAATQAQSDLKFLFVYLHSPEHQDTERFCRDVLCNPEVVDFVNQNFVSWGGEVTQSDAFLLSGRLAVSTYPYMALLLSNPGNRVKSVAVIQGAVSSSTLLEVMVRAVDEHGALLIAERAEREEREMDRLLREQQNAEYEEALAADREREARREAERRVIEDQERARREEEARIQAEKDADQKRTADKAAAIVRRRETKRAGLPVEPAVGTSGAAQIRVRMPDGSNHVRSFLADNCVQQLYDWVDSLDNTTFWDYQLVSNFPRQVFDKGTVKQSLQAANLVPQAALFVQVMDD